MLTIDMLRFPKTPHAWADGLTLVFQHPVRVKTAAGVVRNSSP
jgi:hypothetical protein